MYKCCRCGERFREPDVLSWREHHGEGMYETMCEYYCPYCGDDEMEEVYGDEEDEEEE